VDPRAKNECQEACQAERHHGAYQIAPPTRLLLVVLGPVSVEAGRENPGTQEWVQDQQVTEVIGESTMGHTTEENLQQIIVPPGEPGIDGHSGYNQTVH